MPELLNCPRCNKIFVKNFRDVCTDCHKQEEEDFQNVHQFIRKKENRMASIIEVEEATEVTRELIYKFVKQGRIHISMFPNLTYPCEACGKQIREGRICLECKGNITGGLERDDREKQFQDRKRQEENSRIKTYHSLSDKINKRK